MPRLFISAGDTSGDQHSARLVRRLRELVPDLAVEGHGGPELVAAGCHVHTDLVRQSIFGLGGALAAVPEMFGVLRRTAGVFDARRPDAVVIVDYPGFNLYVARLAHRRGIPVVYFVAPQLWAWATWRARRFARVLDEALVIFPFEEDFWRGAGLEAHYVGHPLLDTLPADPSALAALRDPAIAAQPRPVALLPGSRPREVAQHMPVMLAAAAELLRCHPDCSFHSAHVAPTERQNMDCHARAAGVPLTIHDDRVHAVMASCRCAIVASGTATLETGMLGTPLVLLYKVPRGEDVIGRRLLVPPWVGQVNLLAGRAVHPEVLQSSDDPAELIAAVEPLVQDGEAWREQRRALAALRDRLHTAGGGAVEGAARRIAARLFST
jgi:lipid-A-disaccharide synthase